MWAMAERAFISYRRDDTSGYAGRIYDRLQDQFPDQIFMDVTGIEAGVDFVESIDREVRASNVLVALIGKHWLDADRLNDAEDFVNREIALALENKIPVIPVLLRGARMPSAAELPDSLKPLSRRNAIEIGEATFDRDMAALINTLRPRLGRKGTLNWKWIITAGALFIALVVVGSSAVILRNVWMTPTPTPTPGPTPSLTPTIRPEPGQPGTANSDNNAATLGFEPVGKWRVSTGGATAGAMDLNLKPNQTYEISKTEGTFQQVASFIGNSGTWTYNRSDMRLTLLGTGSGYGLAIRITGKQGNGFSAMGTDGVPYMFVPAS
jgi:TIR domain